MTAVMYASCCFVTGVSVVSKGCSSASIPKKAANRSEVRSIGVLNRGIVKSSSINDGAVSKSSSFVCSIDVPAAAAAAAAACKCCGSCGSTCISFSSSSLL